MKVLVTGGAGFIGSSLVIKLLNYGHTVINVDSLTYAASLDSLSHLSKNPDYIFEHADIRDRDTLDKIFSNHKPDAVMHLAAESHVDRSIDGPIDFIETNVTGTFNMLEASRCFLSLHESNKEFRFLHVSTDEVYGSLCENPAVKFNENTSYNPSSPYSASKACSDHLVFAWQNTYGLPVILTNCSNNYGPRQFPEKLIPLMIINALTSKKLPIYGNGSNIRDWLFVEDHVEALILILEKGVVGRRYNIGGENELTNTEVVKKICLILDKHCPNERYRYSDLIEFVEDRPGHDTRYAIDIKRIKEELGWSPILKFEEGLEKTILWYLNNKEWWQSILKKQKLGKRLGVNL